MATRRSNLKRRKMMKYAEIAVATLLIAALVTVAIVMYPRTKASDYFNFSDLEPEYEIPTETETHTINIKRLNLTVMPIKGDATNFTINPGGNTDPLYYSQIRNGTKQKMEITLNSPVQSIRDGSAYPFTVFVHSDEAEGNVTLQIRLKASDYFIFTDLGAEGERIANSSYVLKLQKLYLAVIPVLGNATEFHIDPGGDTDPLEFYEPRIDNGTSHVIEATLTSGVQSTKNGNTYPVRIFVYCAEAEGYITLQIPEENVVTY